MDANRIVRATQLEPFTAEPWVRLADGTELHAWGPEEEIAYNQMNRQAQKRAFFVQAFDFLTDNRISGDYYEFGCHRGRTFRMALTEARRHNLDGMNFFAFDSFSGLPEVSSPTAVPEWKKGALCTSEEEFLKIVRTHGIYVDRCRTIKGFYQETLTPSLQDEFLAKGTPISFVCVDCDLFESAVPVFRFIDPLLQEGSLIYIDDYFAGYKILHCLPRGESS